MKKWYNCTIVFNIVQSIMCGIKAKSLLTKERKNSDEN